MCYGAYAIVAAEHGPIKDRQVNRGGDGGGELALFPPDLRYGDR